jgi:hypothetical protein
MSGSGSRSSRQGQAECRHEVVVDPSGGAGLESQGLSIFHLAHGEFLGQSARLLRRRQIQPALLDQRSESGHKEALRQARAAVAVLEPIELGARREADGDHLSGLVEALRAQYVDGAPTPVASMFKRGEDQHRLNELNDTERAQRDFSIRRAGFESLGAHPTELPSPSHRGGGKRSKVLAT